MEYVIYMFDEMASTLDEQLSTLKAADDAAIAKMSVAAAGQAAKKKKVEDLQLRLLEKQKAFDGKQSAYNHAATAETEGIKKLAGSTNKIDMLQVKPAKQRSICIISSLLITLLLPSRPTKSTSSRSNRKNSHSTAHHLRLEQPIGRSSSTTCCGQQDQSRATCCSKLRTH